jgi:two-component system, OmpR family, response regulator RegX3
LATSEAAAGAQPGAQPVERSRVLVVEDDETIAVPLEEGLTREGFAVTRVRLGADALTAAAGSDLVLLDLGLPDLDGAEVCRRLRAITAIPIIVLTARGDELDRVMLLELGADDYVVKPFGFRELVARIRAVRRRTSSSARGVGAVVDGRESGQRVGELMIDRRTRRVRLGDGEVHLTPKEFDLLARLADDPGAVVRRDDLMAEVWDEHWWGSTKTLDVHVAALRKKLGDRGWIIAIRGVGYRLDPPAARSGGSSAPVSPS